ncbi:MAG: valine--tRNA ligase [bacterium]|nr:valine--tRNA ligase [bacterium]
MIADHRVDKEFGTGAVKVTPAHDFNDFAFGNDHNLPRINVLTVDGKMNEAALHYKGMDRFECRKQLVQELEENGFLEKTEPYKTSIGHCYRCHTIVEPYLSLQWFVRTQKLAAKAIKAVQKKETTFTPENWENTYFDWMENIKDWCISRQIWWGHQIPAWYCDNEKCPVIVAKKDPTECPHCHSKKLTQDTDVLDTWFSSGLWPFSTLGWPEKTQELKTFYPTSLLITGFDIIFFWVARMMMMGLEFMGEVPFREVHIHALVRDAQGQKMSKSKGNVIDPLTLMERFGTDAFRFTLASLAAQGRDIKLSEQVIEGYRNFANKIWNATRFSLINLGETKAPKKTPTENLSLFDKWILQAQNQVVEKVDRAYAEYHFDEAAKTLYDFFWKSLCDWYLEFSKINLNKEVLAYVLERSLRLLHPIMPFLTEELWQKVSSGGESISLTSFPEKEKISFEKEFEEVETLQEIIGQIRMIRSENRISPAVKITALLFSKAEAVRTLCKNHEEIIQQLGRLESFEITDKKVDPKGKAHAASTHFDLFIPLAGLIDLGAERQRIEKEIGRLQNELRSIEGKLSQPSFVERAPADIVAGEKARQSLAQEKIAKLETTLKNIL